MTAQTSHHEEHGDDVVDLSSFHDDNPTYEARYRAARSLFYKCRRWGFANIVGHGLSQTEIDEAFRWQKELFDLPLQDKLKAPHPPTAMPHRGYSAPGKEKVYAIQDRENGKTDEVIAVENESYEVGSEKNAAQPNIWLPDDVLPGYRDYATRLFARLNEVSRVIREALAMGLQLSEDDKEVFSSKISGHNSQLRFIHYPSTEVHGIAQKTAQFMPAHQDWSLFTLDFQDSTGGLEAEDPCHPGEFFGVRPIPGACVLNVGDMLHRLTNGIFPSLLHRVGLPPVESDQRHQPETKTRSRYATIFFHSVDDEAIIEPLPGCVTSERPSKFEPVQFSKYGEWLSQHMYSAEDTK